MNFVLFTVEREKNNTLLSTKGTLPRGNKDKHFSDRLKSGGHAHGRAFSIRRVCASAN